MPRDGTIAHRAADICCESEQTTHFRTDNHSFLGHLRSVLYAHCDNRYLSTKPRELRLIKANRQLQPTLRLPYEFDRAD